MNNLLINTIFDVRKKLQRYLNETFKEDNLKSAEILFMHILHINGQCSQISLSKDLVCDKAHTHRITARLKDKNLIEFAPADGQNKNHILRFTPKGKQVAEKIEKAYIIWNEKLKEGISEEEIATLKNIVLKLQNNANELKMGVRI